MCASKDQPSEAAGVSTISPQRAALLAHVIEAAPEIMGACDDEGHVVLLNRAGREWFGLPDTADGLPEIGCTDMFPPATARLIKEVALPAATRDGQWHGETVMRDRDGRERLVDQTISVLREADGTVAGFSTTIHDRAALEEVQKALLESEQRFSKAFYASPDPYVIADFATGDILDVNDSFVRTFGWSREEAHGRRASELGFWADLAERDRFLEDIRRDGEVQEMEQHRPTRAGEIVVCRCTAFRVNIGGRAHTLYRLRNVTQERAMERALRDSEELFSAVFRESPVPMLVVELATDKIVAANDRFCEFLGHPRQQLVGHAATEFHAWVDQGERRAVFDEIQRHGSVRNRIVRICDHTGAIRQGRFAGEQLELGGRKCVLTVFEDLTELLRAEEALRESEQKFAKAFHASPDPITIGEYPGGRMTEVNDAYCRLFGCAREELVGHSGADLGMWADLRDRERYYELLARDGAVPEIEAGKVKRNGDRIIGRITAHRLEIAGRSLVVTRMLDVTDHRKAERALRESEEKFAKAFQAAPDSVTIATFDEGRILDVNDGFTQLHGWTREEAVGRTSVELDLWGDLATRQEVIGLLREGKIVRNRPAVGRDRQGGLHQCLYSGETTEIGGVRCLISIVRDITDRQRLEEQLRQAQKMEAVGQLAGGVAHDFNNILTVIQAHTSLLREDQRLPAEVHDSLREIAQSAHFAASLTRQLLLFSRKQVLQPGRVVLSEVVARMAQLLKRVIGETIVLEFSAPLDVPDIQADAGMVEQVLLNLVVNARDAMPRGGCITIATRVITADADYVAACRRREPAGSSG